MTTTPGPSIDLPDVHATITRAPGRITITLAGEVDADLRDYLVGVVELVARSGDPVEADLSQVTFFCAEGVRFLEALRSAAPGDALTINAISPAVATVLDLCDFQMPQGPSLASAAT